MSKELEALEKLLSFAFVMSENMVGLSKGNYDEKYFIKKTYEYLHKYNVDLNSKLELKEALQHLESINSASPSKALESLERLKTAPTFMGGTTEYMYCISSETLLMQDYENVRQVLLKSQEQEKVLKIIKEKEVNMQVFNQCEDVEVYNNVYKKQKDRQLTDEEFDILKRYFNEEKD